MAEYRYGKEEMLALFIEGLVKPIELDHFSSITREKSHFPLAFVPPTEEEQRYSLGSVNSNAVLKLMGRGAPRGAARGARGGLAGRGRGRGDGGFMRQSSYEEARTDTGGFRDPRRQSWEEGRRGAFERGNPSGKGYDPTMRGRLSSDTTWDKNEKGGHENWRAGVQHDAEDDGGGWRVSGHRYADKSDRWRGGPRITRSSSWRNSDSFRDERSFTEEEWQVARGSRVRSFHERDDRWNNPSEPEWCKDDDFEDLDVTGTFDSSGAFRSRKKEDNKSNVDVEEEKYKEENLQANGNSEELANDQAQPENDENKANDEKPPQAKQTETAESKSTVTTQEMVQPSSSLATASQPVTCSSALETEKTPRQIEQFGNKSENKKYEECESDKKDEEPNMEHFAKAAENLVKSLDDEVEKSDPDSHPPGFHGQTATTPTSQLEEIRWFYTDPQGKMQGPFKNTEMADWFNHGYFTMNLMIKRSIDEAFQPLGDLIKSWGRVLFLPGPQPPPLKGIPDQLQQQHLLAQQQQQQQYQQLLQQHMMQQRFLQQQALIMQQQLHMQHQQEQVPTTAVSPQSTTTHMDIPPPHMLQSTLEHQQHLQQKVQELQQHHQQQPQALSVSSESIWAGSGATSTSPVISPGPWSQVTTASVAAGPSPPSPLRGWDVEHGNNEKIQSLQEIQKKEEENELAIKLENERREAAIRKEEELRRRQQQEYLLQRQREQEERRRQEEIEKKKRKQEELLKKQEEEARRHQEEELQQQKREQKQQAARQKQLEQQKRQMEEQKMVEMRKQQQQALARLQQQQQELQRRKEIEEQKQKELQQKLHQKRQQSQNTSNSLWGPTPLPAAPSLTEIQEQQEKRERSAQQEKERLVQQEREQRNAAAAAAAGGWTERNNQGTSSVKSLLEIQQEQERQQLAKKENQQLSRSHPSSHNPLSSTVWGNNSSALSSSWTSPVSSTPSIIAWGGASKSAKQPSRLVGLSNDEDDNDDDDEEEEEEESFWDEAVKEAKKAGQNKQQSKSQQQQRKQQQQQQPKPQSVQPAKNRQSSNAAFPGLGNKTQSKRTTKDEENIRRIFQQQSSASDEFARWFEKSLKALKVTSIDIPTFFAFLQEIESPYEVHDYVKSYIGDNKEANEFARDFIEQRKRIYSRQLQNTLPTLPQECLWGNVNQKPQSNKSGVSQQVPQEECMQADTTTSKKKKKKKMQKVDPRILGFSVNAAERVNIGEIQTLEDA
ncbi:GRB10-interacting GYF protein 2-like isoform X2 [Actinia tenebrosa]|nr:GRB10-interacting GYF protein 2-like isoform X2 [Actinia tenebrosa]